MSIAIRPSLPLLPVILFVRRSNSRAYRPNRAESKPYPSRANNLCADASASYEVAVLVADGGRIPVAVPIFAVLLLLLAVIGTRDDDAEEVAATLSSNNDLSPNFSEADCCPPPSIFDDEAPLSPA